VQQIWNIISKFIICVFVSLSLCGCLVYKLPNSSRPDPHPADPYGAVLQKKTSQTLDIDDEHLPKKPDKESKMDHMHSKNHVME